MKLRIFPLVPLFLIPLLIFFGETWATPYVSPSDWEQMKTPVTRLRLPLVEQAELLSRLERLTDEGYSYLSEYIQICDFLTVWQVADTLSPDFGGMIEGESGDLINIIQTDNTQESIRVWAHHGRLTGDTARYRENIDAAWTYTMNFPAYSEEGETDYYRVHNCGWALVAQMEYLDVYGDSTYFVYADSCAEYILHHPLSFTLGLPYYQQLHPLVTGWAAGTLYQYGQYIGNQAYIDTALVQGERVKEWIEEDPNRLAYNEIWAMSGGTAMWGVVNSVFQEDSLTGIAWLETYAPYMDTYSGAGNWNNSWNIWYSHAHRAIYDMVEDSLYQYYAVALVDTLLFQDTDNDGGIPAGSADPDTMDQTWVSCYTDYMGIEKILNNLPFCDAGVIEFYQPQSGIPVEIGGEVSIMPVAVNYGSHVLDQIYVIAEIDTVFTGGGQANLTLAARDTVEIQPYFIPADTGYFTITAYTVGLAGDLNPANDTAHVEIEIRGAGELTGTVTDSLTGTGLNCELLFYHQEVSDLIPYRTTNTVMPSGGYSIDLMAGEYRIVVSPQIPYNIREFTQVVVEVNQVNDFNMELTAAELLLVDDDDGAAYDTFVVSTLNQLEVESYYWNRIENGALSGNSGLFPMCIWMTGNDSTTTLEDEDKYELVSFLQGGGKLILSGQNIGDDLGAGDPFMNDYLKVDHSEDDVNQLLLDGEEGHPISSGTTLFLVGSPGAGNQNSPSSCIPLNGGEAVYHYQNPPEPIGMVCYEDPIYGYHTIYMAFGIEAISGLANTLPRAGLLENIFDWWGYPTEVWVERKNLPVECKLFPPYPNPFNPSTEISYTIPESGYTELAVYNIMGQRAAMLWSGWQSPGSYSFRWKGETDRGFPAASGIYYCRLSFKDGISIQPIVLLK